MKNLFLMLLLLISIQCVAEKKTPAEKAKAKTEEMQKDLNLTPEQNTKIYDLNLRTYTSIADYEKKKTSKTLKKKQKDIVTDLRKAEFKKILTSAQFKKYEELKKIEKDTEKAEKQELEKLKTKSK